MSAPVGAQQAAAGVRQSPPAGNNPSDDGQPPNADDFDVIDLLRVLLHRDVPANAAAAWNPSDLMIAVAPIIGARPSTGAVLGAGVNAAVYFGDPQTTRISSGVLSVSFSAKKQTSITARFGAFSEGDELRVDGDNRFLWTSQENYGLGTSSDAANAVSARFTYVRVFESVFHEIRNGVFAGAGLHVSARSNIRPDEGAEPAWNDSAFVAYSDAHGFDLESQASSGIGLNLMLDTRDNPINASRGWLASASYRPFFDGFLGGNSTWQELLIDARAYRTVRSERRQTVALWLYGDFVTGGTAPYFDLPTIGMDTYGRSGRGYAEGRFRGERLLYGEVEYRATLSRNGLLGMVAFGNLSTFSNLAEGEKLFDAFAPAGGAGLRLLFNKRSRTNLCIDFGFGQHGSHGVYLALQEAF